MKLEIIPIEFVDACYYVKIYHRHHKPPIGAKFSIACTYGDEIVGVIIVGRPVARGNQDGWTLEVIRLATNGTKNACSKLYAAAWRATRAMGYKRLITYILQSEKGTSLIASGWKEIGRVKGRSWSCKSRPRIDKHPLDNKIKFAICKP